MRLALLLLHFICIGAPVVDEKLDDALWQKAKEALGEHPQRRRSSTRTSASGWMIGSMRLSATTRARPAPEASQPS